MTEQVVSPTPARTARPRSASVTALVAGIGLAGFVLVACGGGSTKTASSAASPSSAVGGSTAVAGGSTAAAGSSTSASGSATGSSAGSATSSSAAPHGSSSSSFCGFARAVDANQAKDVTAFTSGNPAEIEKVEKKDLALLTVAVSTAPSSIRPAMTIIATADRKLYNELQAVNFDFRKLTTAQAESLGSPALTHASDMVTSYLTTVCHISTASPTAH